MHPPRDPLLAKVSPEMGVATMPAPRLPASRRWRYVLLGAGVALFLWALYRTAFVCDDAYITLRTVRNALDGHGLRWNSDDRVQTYTHPLWMLLLLGAAAVTGEFYFTTLALGAVTATAAVATMAWCVACCTSTAALLLLAMTCSRRLVDFSTSGLENPLVYLFLAVFAALWAASAANPRLARQVGIGVSRHPLQTRHAGRPSPRRFVGLCLLGSGLLITRTDTFVLVLPGLLQAAWQLRWRRALALGALGALPAVAWLSAATVYYGFPLPVTASAKLFAIEVPFAVLVRQGLSYCAELAHSDPLTAVVIVVGLGFGLCRRDLWPLALGIALHLGYVICIGGDFMSGRFLTPAAFSALLLLARFRLAPRLPMALGLAVLMVGIAARAGVASLPVLSPADFKQPATPRIGDERGLQYWASGLRSPTRMGLADFQAHARHFQLERLRGGIAVATAVGTTGFTVGAMLHLVDPVLCDPLLARLPVHDPTSWAPGHGFRRVPEGYYESLRDKTNHIRHPGLARYYDALTLAIRGDLFTAARLAALWRLLSGQHDADLRRFVAEEYRAPPVLEVALAELADSSVVGKPWFHTKARLVYAGGLRVRLPHVEHAGTLVFSLEGAGLYGIAFLRDGATLAELDVVPPGAGTMVLTRVAVPGSVRTAGYDAVVLRPKRDVVHAVGHLALER